VNESRFPSHLEISPGSTTRHSWVEQPAGAIVNISSIHAHMTRSGMFPYAAAKSGMLGLTRSLALDLAPEQIRVSAVGPGFIRTPPIEQFYNSRPDPNAAWARLNQVHPLGRIGMPEEVAKVVARSSPPRPPAT
jgi:NAD(P)-dependent dehydrogenase (short-subunit alcohol dehydrogenase family)